ncbi:MAG TPA: hypothetical protein VIM25_03790, partial [Candidatus Limnocylindrales bacterium]
MRARPPFAEIRPVRTGPPVAARMTHGSAVAGGGSILRRIVGNDRVDRVPGPLPPITPMGAGVEAELAERLDN